MSATRRQFIGNSARLAFALSAGVPLLQACGGDKSEGSTNPIKDGLEPEKGPLRIINYADYVNPDVIADFEKLYGVKVEVTTINSGAEMTAKIVDPNIKIDISHSMSATSLGRYVAGGLVMPLNKSYIANVKNILPAFNDPWYDKGAVYSMPYTFFGTGIGFRSDRIDVAEVEAQGWDTIWNATKFKGQVSILDDEREAFAMAMLRRGITDINTTDPELLDQALADILELIDLVNVKVNIEGYKDIPEGATTIAQTWSADLISGAYSYLPEGTDSSVLGFWHPPTEQYAVGNDMLGVMSNAQSPVLAHHYLDYILDNDVSEKNFSWVGYLPALTKLDANYVIGAGYVPEHLRNCVPTNDDITKGLQFRDLGIDGDLLYEETWSKFRAGA
jgi:spermidine/putrescine transport system substrate-binding protein